MSVSFEEGSAHQSGVGRVMKSVKDTPKTMHQFSIKTIEGEDKPLKSFKGKVVLLVNVASKCGLTPQYEGLEELYRKYKHKDFVVVGFPCNQFAGQEPGTEKEIKLFCQSRYDVSFPLMSKIDVNGPTQHPLYEWLTGKEAKFPGGITWNFEKFLISKSGEVITRFNPKTPPSDPSVISEIEKALS